MTDTTVLHITRGPDPYRCVIRCPSSECRCRRRHVIWVQEWYDPHATCCHCGFTRGLAAHLRRKDSARARKARAMWPLLERLNP